MATTPTEHIYYPTGSDLADNLPATFGAMAGSIESAFERRAVRMWKVATASDMSDLLTDPVPPVRGDLCFVENESGVGADLFFIYTGNAWVNLVNWNRVKQGGTVPKIPWGDITSKPTKFTPTAHTHKIDDLPSTWTKGVSTSITSSFKKGLNVSGGNLKVTGRVSATTGITAYTQLRLMLNDKTNKWSKKPGGSANVNIMSNGYIRKTSSLRALKREITPLNIPLTAVLAMSPVSYYDASDYDERATHDNLQRYAGFIVEDFQAIGGLDELILKDDKGNPEALAYDRICAAQQLVIQDQQSRIESLEERLTKLESMI